MSRGGSFACCWVGSDAALVTLNDGACNADGGGGGGALEGDGIVGAICPTLGFARPNFPASNGNEEHVL